jgi:hypothetical protein
MTMTELNETETSVATEEAVRTPVPQPEAPPPLNATAAVQLDPLDFLTYERNLSRVQKSQLTVQMYEREMARAQEELSRLGHVHTQHVILMAAKHNVDLNAMMVSDDGFFMPRPPQALRR